MEHMIVICMIRNGSFGFGFDDI